MIEKTLTGVQRAPGQIKVDTLVPLAIIKISTDLLPQRNT